MVLVGTHVAGLLHRLRRAEGPLWSSFSKDKVQCIQNLKTRIRHANHVRMAEEYKTRHHDPAHFQDQDRRGLYSRTSCKGKRIVRKQSGLFPVEQETVAIFVALLCFCLWAHQVRLVVKSESNLTEPTVLSS